MKKIEINNIEAKYWNGETYKGFIYLDDVKTKIDEDAKSDIVDIILHDGITEAYVSHGKSLTTEQVEKIKAMKPTLMKNSIEVVMKSRSKFKLSCANYIRKNF